MKLNAMFPTRHVGTGPAAIKDWAQAAEALGYHYIEVADHVFGTRARGDWTPNYAETEPFHETFTTLGFLSAVTSSIGLSSGVLVLPQRQTGVVAKQCAEVDLLSAGRLRLGVGVGWNHVEYASLGEDWHTRGARQAEQIEVLRKLWSGDLVSFDGLFHKFEDINIQPPPRQQPIPIWLGGTSDAVMRRAARIGDGWMPILRPNEAGTAKLKTTLDYVENAGRERDQFGTEVWMKVDNDDPDEWAAAAAHWRALGVDMVMLYAMFPMKSLAEQISVLERFKDAVPD
jgi:probable F420-dependent oxidoreductase